MARVTLTEEQTERFRALHAEGLSNRAIARELEIDHQDVTPLLRRLGLTSNVQQPAGLALANARHAEENARARGELAAKLLVDGEHLRETAWEPMLLAQVLPSGELATYEVEPSPKDRLAAFQAVNAAVNASLNLDRHDATTDFTTTNLILATAEALGLTEDGE